MSMARTARRRRKQATMNNAQWSGLGVPRYGRPPDVTARKARDQRKRVRWAKTGSNLAGNKT